MKQASNWAKKRFSDIFSPKSIIQCHKNGLKKNKALADKGLHLFYSQNLKHMHYEK